MPIPTLPDRSKHIDWRGPNFVTYLLICAVAIVLYVDWEAYEFLAIDGRNAQTTLTGAIATLMRFNASFYAFKIDAFTPATPLDAKRANEQIKSLANAISGIAAAGVIAVSVKQIPQPEPDYILLCLSAGIAFYVHTGARDLLGRLKDESFVD